MLFQGQVTQNAPTARATGNPNALQAQLGELSVSQLLPRYTDLTWSGQVYSVSVATAATITAYTGGGAGTPQVAVWNPAGTGKNLVTLFANTGISVAASVAGTVSWNVFFGPTAAITATPSTTFPLNQLSLQPTGSVAKAFTATALSSSTALTNAIPVGSYYFATAANANLVTQPSLAEFAGHLIIPPGSMMALGGSSAIGTWSSNLSWVEVPI